MTKTLRVVAGTNSNGQQEIPLAAWMDADYENDLRLEARRTNLPLWVLRRLGLTFGTSPYKGMFEEVAPAEYFGNATVL